MLFSLPVLYHPIHFLIKFAARNSDFISAKSNINI